MKKKKTPATKGRPKQPIKRYVSKEALQQLEDHLITSPATFAYFEVETLWFLLDQFYRLPLYKKDLKMKKNEFIPIATSYFKLYITNNYKKYIQILIDADLIECDGHSSKEDHICLGYKLNVIFEGKLSEVYIQPSKLIWKAITRKRNKQGSHKKMEEHIKQMKQFFRKINFDFEGAFNFLDRQLNLGEITLNQYNVRYLCIKAMKNKGKSLFFNQNHTNFRIDSNLTNMKRELRNFIIGDFIQIDLANSQPYLFNHLLINLFQRVNLSFTDVYSTTNTLNPFINKLLRQLINPPNLDLAEILKYNELTRSGKIYDLFTSNFNITRDEAKELFLASFYSSNYSSKYEKAKDIFKAEFPTIHNLIKQFKWKDHASLSIAMQNLESEIFIETIARKLFEMGIDLYTVHDSVIIERQHEQAVIKVMEDVFIQYFGEIPTFKVEALTPEKLNIIPLIPEVTPEQLGIPSIYDYYFETEFALSA